MKFFIVPILVPQNITSTAGFAMPSAERSSSSAAATPPIQQLVLNAPHRLIGIPHSTGNDAVSCLSY